MTLMPFIFYMRHANMSPGGDVEIFFADVDTFAEVAEALFVPSPIRNYVSTNKEVLLPCQQGVSLKKISHVITK